MVSISESEIKDAVEKVTAILEIHSLKIDFLDHKEFMRKYRENYGSIDQRNLFRITGHSEIMAVNIGNVLRLLKTKKQCTKKNFTIYIIVIKAIMQATITVPIVHFRYFTKLIAKNSPQIITIVKVVILYLLGWLCMRVWIPF